jgi:uncharacterized membrane protein
MRLHRESSLAKTASFAVIHLAIAVSLGWLFTGGFVLGGLLALVEPLLNTVVAHHIEKGMARVRLPARRRALVQSGLLAVSHLIVAVAVGWWLSNSLWVATAYAVVEPLANAVAHYFFDRWWHARVQGAAADPQPA